MQSIAIILDYFKITYFNKLQNTNRKSVLMVENVHRAEDRYQLNHIWSSFSIFYGVSCMHVQKKETVNRNSTLLGLMNYDNSNERGERERGERSVWSAMVKMANDAKGTWTIIICRCHGTTRVFWNIDIPKSGRL